MKSSEKIGPIIVGFARDGSKNFITAHGLKVVDMETSSGYMFLRKHREDEWIEITGESCE